MVQSDLKEESPEAKPEDVEVEELLDGLDSSDA
jgi:hypothetical protein